MVAMGIAAIAGIDAEREGFGPLFLLGAPLCRAASCGKRLFKFFADPLIPLLLGNLPLIRKRTNYVALSIRMAASANGCFGCRDLIIG
jgi:hypothetical protein